MESSSSSLGFFTWMSICKSRDYTHSPVLSTDAVVICTASVLGYYGNFGSQMFPNSFAICIVHYFKGRDIVNIYMVKTGRIKKSTQIHVY